MLISITSDCIHKGPISTLPGRLEKIDYEYERKGTCNVIMASEPLIGKRMVKITEHRKIPDWSYFIENIALKYKNAKKITLIMDNLNTHKPESLYETFSPEKAKALWDRFEFVFTPVHGSWLNIAEIELSVLKRQCLPERIPDINLMKRKIRVWNNERNSKQTKVDWQFTTEDARIKLKRLYPKL